MTEADVPSQRFKAVRCFTEALTEPLETEDFVIQSIPDVSPTRWHLAHTTWFWETFVLKARVPGYRSPEPAYEYLFNSYYNAVGAQYPRPRRGLLSRPTVAEVFRYRARVDAAMDGFLSDAARAAEVAPVIELGLNHEQQHQELLLTDIKHVFSVNPLRPAYRPPDEAPPRGGAPPMAWRAYDEGLRWLGFEGGGFSFDNEGPRHRAWVDAFALGTRLVTNGEYLAFVEDGGYRRPELWLSAGWAAAQEHGWEAPLYWERGGNGGTDRRFFTLHGMADLDPDAPVCHVSYYEADAYARWAGARLPSEEEWEVASADAPPEGNFAENGRLEPVPAPDAPEGVPVQMFGDVWEWTRSPYAAYPGYAPDPGALGEYNGKFMCGQFVLRGGSCATSRTHIRPTYRNFFPPDARWQFTGIRLARDA